MEGADEWQEVDSSSDSEKDMEGRAEERTGRSVVSLGRGVLQVESRAEAWEVGEEMGEEEAGVAETRWALHFPFVANESPSSLSSH